MVNDGANDYFYLQEHLYSTVALLNSAGTVVERYEYDAYGKVTFLTSGFGLLASSQHSNPYLFAGYRFDANTKLYHTLYRSYDPYTGRWLQHDPLGYADSMSLYEYVVSNPANYTDPWGLMSNAEFQASIEQTNEAYREVLEAIEHLGVMATNGNASESQLYAKVAEIEQLYNQYRSQKNSMMSSVNEVMSGNWLWMLSGSYRNLMDTAFDLSGNQDQLGGYLTPDLALLAEARRIACNVCESSAKTANSTQMTYNIVHTTETTLTVATAVGGVGLLGQQAVKLGVKEGAKYLAKQAAVMAATQAATTLIVSKAEKMGFSETQIRAGVAAFQILSTYKAFTKSKTVCTKKTFDDKQVKWNNNNGWRTADGKFASPQGAGRAGETAETAVWDAVKAKPGWDVVRGRVYVRDASGQLRVYDGAAISPNGRVIGL